MLMLLLALACEDGAETHTQAGHGPDAHGADAHGSDAHGAKAHGADAHGTDAHAGHAAPKAEPHGAADAGQLSLSLNEGAKWQLDANTRTVFAETRTTLKGAKPTTLEEAHSLAATLQEQQGRLIRGCTMEGSSHDELHVFLQAWIPGVKALGESGTLSESQAQLATLRGYMDALDKHFE